MKKNKKVYRVTLFLIVVICLLKPFQVFSANREISFDVFLQENGLPNNKIQCVFQDEKGWMWIGTNQGISRFNGYSFVNFLSYTNDSNSIDGNLVRVIKEDSKGNLYVGTETGGLNLFDRDREIFTQPYKNHPEFKYKEVSVNDIEEDSEGKTWLGTGNNILVIDTTGNLVPLKPQMVNSDINFTGNFVRNLEFDRSGKLWVGTDNGVFLYDPVSNEMELFPIPFFDKNSQEILEIYLDNEGLIWIGTISSGVFLVDPVTRVFHSIELDPSVERAKTVRSISKGVFGEYWIGTRGGLFVYSKSEGITAHYEHNSYELKSLSDNSVLSVFHDSNGETWVGTRRGLNLLAKSKQVFHNHMALVGDNRYLNNASVNSLWIDKKNKIWIGTEDGGINIYDPLTNTYEYLIADEQKGNTISRNCVKSFLEDKEGRLWVGTQYGGIDIIDLQTKKISHFKQNPEQPGSLSDSRVWDICMDNEGEIWVASTGGVDKFIPETNLFEHYPELNGNNKTKWIELDSKGNLWMGGSDEIIVYNKAGNTIKRFPEHTNSMFESTKNEIWIATEDFGIAIYSANAGPIKYYDENDGLANNQAVCILEDNKYNLWISTTNGLSKFDTDNEVFHNFSSKDGLCNNQFCVGASYKTTSGELLFGSITGFSQFNPDEIIMEEKDVPIVLTDLKIFNKSVPISNDDKSVLRKSISETDHLTLNYNQDVFTIEFAALDYVNSENNVYTYMLEGFNKEWNEPGTVRTATYTNLNHGEYTLRIRHINPGNLKVYNESQLKITILPPYWKTDWFFALFSLAMLFLFFILFKFIIDRERIKNELVFERVNARKLHELNMLKLKFFTNVSHEIRTPLTLILGPLEEMMQKNTADKEDKDNLNMIHRNAKNLDKLISQILDFRKLQSGNLKINLTDADIVSFIRNIVNSFKHHAIEKEISLSFNTSKKRLFASFDPDKIEKILNNLLSNAFKYTESGGSITINLSLIFASDEENFIKDVTEKQFIKISVKDTGKGIASKNLNRIFMRFFQTDEGNKNSGAGIGLSLVKELVTLHRGSIDVTSKPGKGSKFVIRIPYNTSQNAELDGDAIHEEIQKNTSNSYLNTLDNSEDDLYSKIMLLVDDNSDIRQFMAGHFKSDYKIYEAANGKDGWEVALKVVPDIIISDIIMPKNDGYEFCKRLKNDERTSHIPVLLLTAMHSKEQELKGLTIGADDYITKPFDLSVLRAKVENVLSIREALKVKYSSTMVLEPTNVVLTSPDEQFLRKAIDSIESNILVDNLDTESFAVLLGVSRTQLYRKINALTDMTVKEFIRHIRLKRATQLLAQQKFNVSEVAYKVGFKDLSHFRKSFKREYGMSASEYVAKSKKTIQ